MPCRLERGAQWIGNVDKRAIRGLLHLRRDQMHRVGGDQDAVGTRKL